MCTLSTGLNVHAQSIEEIKSSNTYVWGEGSGHSTEAAEQAALAQMSRSISVTIFNKTLEADANGSNVQQSILQSVSSAKFQNVQIKILSEEPEARIFCYMHRSEVQKMFKQRSDRILDLIETGKIAEERLQIDDALRCYYWALVLSNSNPEPIKISFGEKQGFASSLIPVKIKSILQLLKAHVVEGATEAKGLNACLKFTYDNKEVASLQFNYNDGQSIVGPVVVKDGIGEIDMVSLPGDGKIHLTYEVRFKNEIDPMDGDLRGLYSSGAMPSFDTSAEIPIKLKGGNIKAGQDTKAMMVTAEIAAQPVKDKKTIDMKSAPNPTALLDAVLAVEAAISSNNPSLAYEQFTPNGYNLFCKLLKETGQISLVGKSEYNFIDTDGYLIGRATHIKIKFRSGKTFMENLVYRFDPNSGKIESIAFALTKRAENDIMNAAASWPDISRWAILNFMEDYQTAFALKRLDYISSIFSDKAIIITGTVLKSLGPNDQGFDENKMIMFDNMQGNIKYSKHTKSEYIQRLEKIFKERDYVHLTFENNVTKMIDLPSVVTKGAAFGIEIKQRYSSSGYSDEGYLTLVFDTTGKLPIIYVRLWQPDRTEMMSLQEFISKFSN